MVRGKRLGSWDTAGEWTRVIISSSDLLRLLALLISLLFFLVGEFGNGEQRPSHSLLRLVEGLSFIYFLINVV